MSLERDSFEIRHIPAGGFIIIDPWPPKKSSLLDVIYACNTIEEATKFIKANIVTKVSPNLE